jgi:probable O-glycosylation ligase (exosortase A-associated)
MSIPLWVYLYGQSQGRTALRWAIAAAIVFSTVSALGSQSRGAVLAIIAMAAFLWLKSNKKLLSGFLLLVAATVLLVAMPELWLDRIATIKDPRADASALGRLETWTMLWNLAKDRPFVGGGFETYATWIFERYNPTYGGSHSAHSIYFQVLGEHGFIAFGIFLLYWLLVWRSCSRVAAFTRLRPEHHWAYRLAQMTQVSLIAFLVGGAFQNLAYWDMPYYLFVAIAVTEHALKVATVQANTSVDRSEANRRRPSSAEQTASTADSTP